MILDVQLVRAFRPRLYISRAWQPPAPIGTPVHDDLAARPYVPLDDEGVRNLARAWLVEFGQKARAELAKIRPVVSPATDRDLTGAFPVVAVA